MERPDFDHDLQMFREKPKVDINKLLFQRWLVQNGLGEHLPESRPCGDYALGLVVRESKGIDEVIRGVFRAGNIKRTIVPGD